MHTKNIWARKDDDDLDELWHILYDDGLNQMSHRTLVHERYLGRYLIDGEDYIPLVPNQPIPKTLDDLPRFNSQDAVAQHLIDTWYQHRHQN